MALRAPYKITIEIRCVREGCPSKLPTIGTHDPRVLQELYNFLDKAEWSRDVICPTCQHNYKDAISADDRRGGVKCFAWSDEQKKLYAAWEQAWDEAHPQHPQWHEINSWGQNEG